MPDQPSRIADLEAILFDLDGTLVETDNRWAGMLSDTLEPLKHIWPRIDTQALARRLVMSIEMPTNYVIAVLERLGMAHLIDGLANRVRRSKGLATRGASEPVEGTFALLQALAPRYKLAVVTTRARPEAESFVRQLGFEIFFPVVITRGDVLRMKPHPEPVLKAAALLDVPADRCMMVGDTTMDVRAGQRAGAYTVGVLSGFGDRSELIRAGADLVLDRAAQVLDYL
jgi:phosphoglycolate phosphatase